MLNTNVNYERFPPEYFSGTNIHIFFEDIYIDEISMLSFNMQEQVLPIHGYNSHLYDTMLRGTRIVQGNFAINFKKTNYIMSAVDTILNGGDFSEEDNNFVNNFNVEDKKNELYGYAEEGLSAEFDRLSEDLKDKLWQKSSEKNKDYQTGTYFPDKDITFDIKISYGEYDQPKSKYDVENKYKRKMNTGAVRTINDIQIRGVQQQIDASGAPIQEVYSFIARDLNK